MPKIGLKVVHDGIEMVPFSAAYVAAWTARLLRKPAK